MWYIALTPLPSALYLLATSPLPSSPPSSAENHTTSSGFVLGRHPPLSSAPTAATSATEPLPSSSAPGARRKGRELVLSWCAVMRTAGAEGGTEEEVQRRTSVRCGQEGCMKGVTVRLAEGLRVVWSCGGARARGEGVSGRAG